MPIVCLPGSAGFCLSLSPFLLPIPLRHTSKHLCIFSRLELLVCRISSTPGATAALSALGLSSVRRMMSFQDLSTAAKSFASLGSCLKDGQKSRGQYQCFSTKRSSKLTLPIKSMEDGSIAEKPDETTVCLHIKSMADGSIAGKPDEMTVCPQ